MSPSGMYCPCAPDVTLLLTSFDSDSFCAANKPYKTKHIVYISLSSIRTRKLFYCTIEA